MTQIKLQGGCHCGDIRYEIEPTESTLFVCHCTGCQKQSSSGFGMSLIFLSDAVRLTQGKLKQWTRTTDSGNQQDTFLCGACGSRIWHGERENEPKAKVRAGTLDTPVDLASGIRIWPDSRLPGVTIPPNAMSFPSNPS